ncbi:hypothetical protein [Microbaculum marinum]|uniref:Acyl-CoA dehydrogenase n=1 Tax=Microbaculum marinum TaxID=1764581 RepID=A0AAW9RKU9_9HYPH
MRTGTLTDLDSRGSGVMPFGRPKAAFDPILNSSSRRILHQHARQEDAGRVGICATVDLLRQWGWLEAVLPAKAGGSDLGSGGAGAERSVRALIELARTNLSAARLFEGHVNAVHLLDLYAGEDLRARAFDVVRQGGLLGVWGADATPPVSLDPASGVLRGQKRYASGLGTVAEAVISVSTDDGVRLCLANVSDPVRQDGSTWTMNGMRASASGSYDFDGLDSGGFTMFGAPGAYHREPYFVGGVWRIAAIQLGGTLGLLEAARDRLAELDRLDAPPQIGRLAGILQECLGAIGLVERAGKIAGGIEGMSDPDRAVALSIFARLHTEEVGQRALSAIERSIGLEHFDDSSETGRKARDLAVYMRQVARDALQARAGATGLDVDRDILGLWHG